MIRKTSASLACMTLAVLLLASCTPAGTGTGAGSASAGKSAGKSASGGKSTATASTVIVEEMSTLTSYRALIKAVPKQEGSKPGEYRLFDESIVNAPDSTHIVVRSSDGTAEVFVEESVSIGKSYWIKDYKGVWKVSTSRGTRFGDTVYYPIIYSANRSAQQVGTETVNGVACKHYRYEFNSEDFHWKCTGDVWVADQAGLPKVIVRDMHRQVSYSSSDGSILFDTELEINVTELNLVAPILAPI
jgi:hypothetical protein